MLLACCTETKGEAVNCWSVRGIDYHCILPPHTIGDGFQVSCGSVNIPVSLREIRPGRALIERYGPDILLPDLREELDQCERAR